MKYILEWGLIFSVREKPKTGPAAKIVNFFFRKTCALKHRKSTFSLMNFFMDKIIRGFFLPNYIFEY